MTGHTYAKFVVILQQILKKYGNEQTRNGM